VDDGESSPLEPSPHELYPLLGPPEDLWKTIEELRPDRVVVAVGERPGRLSLPQLLKTKWSGIVVEEGTEIYERLAKKLPIECLTPSRIIASRDFGKLGWLTAAQRALSLTVAALGLLLTWPLMAIIALLIKLDSKGPVFFIQKRMGRRERVFRLIKFRTMHPTSNETTEWVRDNSNRITRIGKWLRKSRLDELPQFVNILLGDMNLVGPRPHPVSNLELFVEKIPYYSLRHMVRPGITGWAQVRYGYANNLDEETEKTRYDLYYIKHLSLWFDLRILFETVRIVLFRPGSKEAFALRAPNLAGASRR
jgi:exopolysaccharide biosynthesis polyprenyl glycosylphosphotransferase